MRISYRWSEKSPEVSIYGVPGYEIQRMLKEEENLWEIKIQMNRLPPKNKMEEDNSENFFKHHRHQIVLKHDFGFMAVKQYSARLNKQDIEILGLQPDEKASGKEAEYKMLQKLEKSDSSEVWDWKKSNIGI